MPPALRDVRPGVDQCTPATQETALETLDASRKALEVAIAANEASRKALEDANVANEASVQDLVAEAGALTDAPFVDRLKMRARLAAAHRSISGPLNALNAAIALIDASVPPLVEAPLVPVAPRPSSSTAFIDALMPKKRKARAGYGVVISNVKGGKALFWTSDSKEARYVSRSECASDLTRRGFESVRSVVTHQKDTVILAGRAYVLVAA